MHCLADIQSENEGQSRGFRVLPSYTPWRQFLAYGHSWAALGCQQVRVSREENRRFARYGTKMLGFFSDEHSDFFSLIFEHGKFDHMSSEISLLRLFLNFF